MISDMGIESKNASNIQTNVASSSPASATGSKISMFTKKAGFVIPKNKLSGSMIPAFRGSKKGDGDVLTEEATTLVLRKTKWGPDLTMDGTVKKGRSLAYQVRMKQISQQLTLGSLAINDNEDSLSTSEFQGRKSPRLELNHENSEMLEFEKREIIGELIRLNPGYKAPSDYKPLLKETNIPIPTKEYPGYNFIDIIFGNGSDTQKRLEKETGVRIRVYGTKEDKEGKFEVTAADINKTNSEYETLYVNVSAETFEKIDAAGALIELLATPVSMNPLASSNPTKPCDDNMTTDPSQSVAGSSVAPVPMEVSRPYDGPFHQYPPSWFLSGTSQTSSVLVGNKNSSVPVVNNLVQVSSNMLPNFGQLPVKPASFSPVPRIPSLVSPIPRSPHSLQQQYTQQTFLPGQTRISGNTPLAFSSDKSTPFEGHNIQASQNMVGSSAPVVNTNNSIVSPPIAPLQSPGTSFGHSVASPGSQLQRGPLSFPHLSAPKPVPSALHLSSVGPILPGAPQAMHVSLPNMPVPGQFMGTSPTVPPQPGPMSAVIPRPQHPNSGDFTFQPHPQQNAAQVSWQSNQPAIQNPIPSNQQVWASQSPPIRPLINNLNPFQFQGPPSPQGNPQMNRPSSQIPMNQLRSPSAPLAPPRPLALPGHHNIVAPTFPHAVPRNFAPPHAGSFPPRPSNEHNVIQQGRFPGPNANYQGLPSPRPHFSIFPGRPVSGSAQQVYDPFSPTSVSLNPQMGDVAKLPKESDPEYDDLMASVGVK